jgi:hypothetical protein
MASVREFAGAGATSGGAGTSWSSASNIISDNNLHATAAMVGNTSSEGLLATQFGFAIPSGATIDGFEVHIRRFANSGSLCDDLSVRLMKDGSTAIGNDYADTVNKWPTSETEKTYGGATDLWGSSWTPAEVNASTFGVRLAVDSDNTVTASVDSVEVTVYYTEAGGGGQAPRSMQQYRMRRT